MKGPYDDIIHLPHPVSRRHPPMSQADRAAQFSPFAALTGYDAAIRETARQTHRRIELDEDAREELDFRLQLLEDSLPRRPTVRVTYFCPDERKEGGEYRTVEGTPRRLDRLERALELEGGKRVPLDEVLRLEGELFDFDTNSMDTFP